jgi:hypothetical protein
VGRCLAPIIGAGALRRRQPSPAERGCLRPAASSPRLPSFRDWGSVAAVSLGSSSQRVRANIKAPPEADAPLREWPLGAWSTEIGFESARFDMRDVTTGRSCLAGGVGSTTRGSRRTSGQSLGPSTACSPGRLLAVGSSSSADSASLSNRASASSHEATAAAAS